MTGSILEKRSAECQRRAQLACPKPDDMERMVFSEDHIGEGHQGAPQRNSPEGKEEEVICVEGRSSGLKELRVIEEAGSSSPFCQGMHSFAGQQLSL